MNLLLKIIQIQTNILVMSGVIGTILVLLITYYNDMVEDFKAWIIDQ